MGIRVSDSEYAEWVRRGLIADATPITPVAAPSRKKPLAPSVFVPPCSFIVGISTQSEANNAGSRRSAIARKAHQRDAVQRLLAMHWSFVGPIGDAARNGLPVTIRLATLGCRERDKWDNLPRSLKAALDGVCLQLGIDDGLPNLRVEYDQFPAMERVGVRIQLECL